MRQVPYQAVRIVGDLRIDGIGDFKYPSSASYVPIRLSPQVGVPW